jgi:hypothetical protein
MKMIFIHSLSGLSENILLTTLLFDPNIDEPVEEYSIIIIAIMASCKTAVSRNKSFACASKN